jgi:hypothetical protein
VKRRVVGSLMVAVLAAMLAHVPVSAGAFGAPGYSPRVPVSPLGLSWFDPSRLHMTSSFSVGAGFGGKTDALQVTQLSYQIGNPLWVSVSLGNSFGPNAGRSQGRFFLEGFQAAYRPMPNMLFQIQYQDFRSPLQASPFGYRNSATPFDGAWAR